MQKAIQKDSGTVTQTPLPTWQMNLTSQCLDLNLVKQIPRHLNPRAIEKAVKAFIEDSHTEGNPTGVYNQMLKGITSAILNGGGNHFWMADEDGEVKAFIVANIATEIDDRLTYWVNSAWVSKDLRGDKIVKEWWEKVKRMARQCLCQNLVIVSSRNPRAYERWMGEGMSHYASLLKQEL